MLQTMAAATTTTAQAPYPGKLDPYASRGNDGSVVDRPDPVVWSTDVSPTGPLTSVEVQHFERHGFVILRRKMSGSKVDAARAVVAGMTSGVATKGSTFDAGHRVIVSEPGKDQVVRSIFAAHHGDDALASLAMDKSVATCARQLLADSVYVHQSRVNVMSAFGGSGFWWHTDFETWHAEDGMPRPRALTAVTMLSRNDETNGSLMVMPGSHKRFVRCPGMHGANNWETSVKEQQTYGTPSREALEEVHRSSGLQVITGDPGDVLLFDCNLIHGSAGNISPTARCNVFVVFNADSNRLQAPFYSPSPRPEHFGHRLYSPTLNLGDC
eukprot:TRINITY_DN43614_c0_g1_i1.p1 TRINITY_DN43614_c0_g1~~TRINITY_DN43614_c0_g1_i1.p1  ORF type:complete len:326 (+),score=45.51 TRINITY_DN43614_c0_g1_i1:52-1029(+)